MSVSVNLPPWVIDQIEQQAEREGRTTPELFEDAVRRYLTQARIRDLQDYGKDRAEQLGIAESDVEPMIHEFRASRRSG